jgi:hypothetical protein
MLPYHFRFLLMLTLGFHYFLAWNNYQKGLNCSHRVRVNVGREKSVVVMTILYPPHLYSQQNVFVLPTSPICVSRPCIQNHAEF